MIISEILPFLNRYSLNDNFFINIKKFTNYNKFNVHSTPGLIESQNRNVNIYLILHYT